MGEGEDVIAIERWLDGADYVCFLYMDLHFWSAIDGGRGGAIYSFVNCEMTTWSALSPHIVYIGRWENEKGIYAFFSKK